MAKTVVRNDEGKVVPEHCSCGGKIGVFIEGEPIYKCTACGKYYGTMPFSKKSLNELLNKENKNMKKNVVKVNENTLRQIVAENVKKVLKEYNQNVEDWWRHNGSFDREQASGIPHEGDDNYLQKTDEWWESLSDEAKMQIYNDFFEEY